MCRALPNEHATLSPTKTMACLDSNVSMSWRQPGGAFLEAVATAVPTPSAAEAMASLKDVGPAAAALTFSSCLLSIPARFAKVATSRRAVITTFSKRLFWFRNCFSRAAFSNTKTETSRPSFLRVAW